MFVVSAPLQSQTTTKRKCVFNRCCRPEGRQEARLTWCSLYFDVGTLHNSPLVSVAEKHSTSLSCCSLFICQMFGGLSCITSDFSQSVSTGFNPKFLLWLPNREPSWVYQVNPQRINHAVRRLAYSSHSAFHSLLILGGKVKQQLWAAASQREQSNPNCNIPQLCFTSCLMFGFSCEGPGLHQTLKK